MEELLEQIKERAFNFANQHPMININQRVVRLSDIEEILSNQVEAPVKHDFCDNTFRLNTTELDILIDVFEGATKNIDQYRVLNKLLKHKLRIVESISKNSV